MQLRLQSEYWPTGYSIECIHPSQRCVTQRIMTDNTFEIETAAVALRTVRAISSVARDTTVIAVPEWCIDLVVALLACDF